ncbi:uncharacterized protein LOC131935518 [Physella acuta]|uniref:uncharacterized protein LOC131935518 n=1 Tax=Physella acuta TaxID=109671 RepID=UPI0027DD5CAE|nr:uncharacterized protein LOC131935518 [Physella acuta]
MPAVVCRLLTQPLGSQAVLCLPREDRRMTHVTLLLLLMLTLMVADTGAKVKGGGSRGGGGSSNSGSSSDGSSGTGSALGGRYGTRYRSTSKNSAWTYKAPSWVLVLLTSSVTVLMC